MTVGYDREPHKKSCQNKLWVVHMITVVVRVDNCRDRVLTPTRIFAQKCIRSWHDLELKIRRSQLRSSNGPEKNSCSLVLSKNLIIE
jgi:hypothetical protein